MRLDFLLTSSNNKEELEKINAIQIIKREVIVTILLIAKNYSLTWFKEIIMNQGYIILCNNIEKRKEKRETNNKENDYCIKYPNFKKPLSCMINSIKS